jgi:hypothetical protein
MPNQKQYSYNILIYRLTDFLMNVARQAKIRHIKFLVSSSDKERPRSKKRGATKERINSDSKEKALC